MEKPLHGRVTIPTDLDVIPQTLELAKRWGADALRDADGTEFPKELADFDGKIYATYYTTRKDNDWARNNPDEVQQCYIMTTFHAAVHGETLTIPLMKGLSGEMLEPNTNDDIKRWWEVIDRTQDAVVAPSAWEYADGSVTIHGVTAFHEYTVSFLAYLIWDPVHMYNASVNDWQDVEKQITFDVRQPKTKEYTMRRLREYLASHQYVDVLRFTTFFHQFTLIFDELRREKYVDWYGYSASVSPYILERFEKEVGYKFRPEFIIDQGYYNNQYRIPSKEYRDFIAFQCREVSGLAKEMVEITHEAGKEAMMFLGDHWIGTEPYLENFKNIGLDAVVGSVGNGATLRLLSDIPGVRYSEGRFLPYFFPDTFHENGNPVAEARENWLTARRAMLRSPVDRIGYGGYLKLALDFPEFVDYAEQLTNEFQLLYHNIEGKTPWCVKTVGVLNCWGRMRSWGNHMVHHALYHKENYSYAGVMEILSGLPVDVRFIDFDEVICNDSILDTIDVLIMVGDADTAHTGGVYWENPLLPASLRRFVHNGKGIIGVGEPSGHQYNGHFFQLSEMLGVEKETGLTLGYDKYNQTAVPRHFITEDCPDRIDFGESKQGIFALEGSSILKKNKDGVQMAANGYGNGRGVYISGLPYNSDNARLLYRSILWACSAEALLHRWFSSNPNVEVNTYNGTYCIVNNSEQEQDARIWLDDETSFEAHLEPGAIQWFKTGD